MAKLSLRIFRLVCPEKFVLLSFISIYLIIGMSLVQHYQYIIFPDGISYISIAQHYIHGRFEYAVNGYWSPLYSWLLVPFLMLWPGKLQALYSTKILGLIIGCVTILGVYSFTDKLNFDIKLKAIVMATLIPWILYFAFEIPTPDLLLLTIVLFYLTFLFDSKYINKFGMGLLTGFTGALAFLSKSYAFLFFLVHFTLTNIFYWFRFKRNRKIIIRNFILGMTVFLIISGVWILIISEKYDKFTIGTAGTYNYALIGPNSQDHPVHHEGLIKPSNDYAFSIWEDPSYLEIESWSPFSSLQNFYHEVEIITKNITYFFKMIQVFSFLSVIIIILALYLSFKSNEVNSKNKLVLILLTIVIYSAGYLMIFLEIRYIWLLIILLLSLGIYSLKTVFEEFLTTKGLYAGLILLLCTSFIISPVFALIDMYDDNEEIYNLSKNLERQSIQGATLAASSDELQSSKWTSWGNTLYLAYYLDAKYYGLTRSSSEKELSEELRKNNIEYYIVWQNESIIDIPGYETLQDPGFDYPKVYRVNGV